MFSLQSDTEPQYHYKSSTVLAPSLNPVKNPLIECEGQ